MSDEAKRREAFLKNMISSPDGIKKIAEAMAMPFKNYHDEYVVMSKGYAKIKSKKILFKKKEEL